MGRKRGFTKTNGLKKKKIARSLRTVSQVKITSIESHAKHDRKLTQIALAQRSQKEKGVPRYENCLINQIAKATGIAVTNQTGIIKIHVVR